MKLHLAIFEDDSELTELLQEMLSEHQYFLSSYLSLKQVPWDKIDLVLADYRNKIVSFNEVLAEAQKHKVPVIAISGYAMDYPLQLQKPFTIEELEALVYRILGQNVRPKASLKSSAQDSAPSSQGWWGRLFSGKKKAS